MDWGNATPLRLLLIRPKIERGSLAYRALNLHASQSFIDIPPREQGSFHALASVLRETIGELKMLFLPLFHNPFFSPPRRFQIFVPWSNPAKGPVAIHPPC